MRRPKMYSAERRESVLVAGTESQENRTIINAHTLDSSLQEATRNPWLPTISRSRKWACEHVATGMILEFSQGEGGEMAGIGTPSECITDQRHKIFN